MRMRFVAALILRGSLPSMSGAASTHLVRVRVRVRVRGRVRGRGRVGVGVRVRVRVRVRARVRVRVRVRVRIRVGAFTHEVAEEGHLRIKGALTPVTWSGSGSGLGSG